MTVLFRAVEMIFVQLSHGVIVAMLSCEVTVPLLHMRLLFPVDSFVRFCC